MANSNPPKKSQTFVAYICLDDLAVPGKLKTNPTLAAGDFKISKDGGAFANLATLPTVTPASGVAVKITIDGATEMNADNVLVVWQDAAGSEWADGWIELNTTA